MVSLSKRYTDGGYFHGPEQTAIAKTIQSHAVISGCKVSQQSTPSMTVDVASGTAEFDGTSTSISAQTVTLNSSESTRRYDCVHIQSDGTATKTTGTAAPGDGTPPSAPNIPEADILLAVIEVPADATEITDTEIRDARFFIDFGANAVAGSDQQIQYNDGGAMGASSDLIWDQDNLTMTVGGKIHLGNDSANRTPTSPLQISATGAGNGGAEFIAANNNDAYLKFIDEDDGTNLNILAHTQSKNDPPSIRFSTFDSTGSSHLLMTYADQETTFRIPDVSTASASNDVQLDSNNQFVIPTSSQRYKSNIQPGAVPDAFFQVEPKWYEDEDGELQYGYIAEELVDAGLDSVVGYRDTHRLVEEVEVNGSVERADDVASDQPRVEFNSDVVREEVFDDRHFDGVPDSYFDEYETEDGRVPDTVNEKDLVPYLHKTILDQREEIESLRERVEALEAAG